MEKSEQEKRVEAYLNEIKFKKRALGGVDEEDVLEKIEELCRLIHEHYKVEILKARSIGGEKFEALKNEAQTLRSEAQTLRNEVQTLRNEAQTLKSKALTLRNENQTLGNENQSVREELKATQERLRQAQSEKDRLRESGGPLSSGLLEEKRSELNRLYAELEKERKIRADLEAENARMRRQSQDWITQSWDISSQEAERLKQEYDDKYKKLVDAINTIQEIKKEAAEAKEEAVQEASKMRSEILEKTREERRRAVVEIRQLQSKVAALQKRRKEIQEIIDARQEVLPQSLDSIILQLQEVRNQTYAHTEAVPLTDITDDPI